MNKFLTRLNNLFFIEYSKPFLLNLYYNAKKPTAYTSTKKSKQLLQFFIKYTSSEIENTTGIKFTAYRNSTEVVILRKVIFTLTLSIKQLPLYLTDSFSTKPLREVKKCHYSSANSHCYKLLPTYFTKFSFFNSACEQQIKNYLKYNSICNNKKQNKLI